jgi:hypothetical protein
MNRKPRLTAAVSVLLLVVLVPLEARASLWGEENAPLYTLVTQGIEELAQGLETFTTLKETYDETRKYVGYAEDAVRAFKDFQNFGEEVLARPQGLVENLFPDIQSYRRLGSGTGPWAEGTGELARVIRQCVGKGAARGCAQFQDAVTVRQARHALEQTFGTVAAQNLEVSAVDYEASVAMSSASALMGRNAVLREQAKALLRQCTEGSSDGAIAACQGAAHAAAILQMQQLAGVADALGELNRLHAVRLAQENAERKRELNEAEARLEAVRAGSLRLVPPRVQVRTGGLEFFAGGAQ